MCPLRSPVVFPALLALQLSIGATGTLRAREEKPGRFLYDHGAIVRGDVTKKEIALVFTGHEFADGGTLIREVLNKKETPASFFFTGDFYRNAANSSLIQALHRDGHYLGPHSDKHLLYCPWENRDALLVTEEEFSADILRNYEAIAAFGVAKGDAPYFIPPYEWYNTELAGWAGDLGLILFNFTPGTLSNADYTTPDMANYRSSARIYQSIVDYEKSDPRGLNGFILLVHIGTHPDRTDKFYRSLERLLTELGGRGYRFVRIDELLKDRESP
jgi:peptidoglycan/xylan/chitin deacetylase (PgdA/CDA1 family)